MFIDSSATDLVLRSILLSIIALFWIIGLVRLVGLRSFSKMTSFDFVVTVATGTLLASAAQASQWASFTQTLLVILTLFALQYLLSRFRFKSEPLSEALSNTPVLLIREGTILDDVLQSRRVSRTDLFAKLREANVACLDDVHAAVLETTGDVSVLHGNDFDDRLLEGVRLRPGPSGAATR